jgi:hypothetical protein
MLTEKITKLDLSIGIILLAKKSIPVKEEDQADYFANYNNTASKPTKANFSFKSVI